MSKKKEEMRLVEWMVYRLKEIFGGKPDVHFGSAVLELVMQQCRDENQGFEILHGKKLLDGTKHFRLGQAGIHN